MDTTPERDKVHVSATVSPGYPERWSVAYLVISDAHADPVRQLVAAHDAQPPAIAQEVLRRLLVDGWWTAWSRHCVASGPQSLVDAMLPLNGFPTNESDLPTSSKRGR